jgi:hypothetical protein
MTESRYVNVPVPEEHVPAVYELLVRLQRGDVPETPPAQQPGPAPEPSRELVVRAYRESLDAHRALLCALADRPGEWVWSSELIDALGLKGRKSLAGTLGSFGRRAKHRYDGLQLWDHEWDRARGEARHRMSPEVAEWVREAASEER